MKDNDLIFSLGVIIIATFVILVIFTGIQLHKEKMKTLELCSMYKEGICTVR